MFSFKGFTTQDRNTHLEHLEDDIINRGSVHFLTDHRLVTNRFLRNH